MSVEFTQYRAMSVTDHKSATVHGPHNSPRSSWHSPPHPHVLVAHHGDILSNTSASSIDRSFCLPRHEPISMSSAAREYAPDGSLVGGDHHVVRGITTGPAFVLHSIRSSSSDVQSCHQTPRLESKGHEEKVVVVTSPQSNHPTPREASKRYEGTMASAQARSTKNLMPRRTSNRYGETFTSEQSDRCVTASELRAVFLALEQYKQEQHTAF